MGKHDSAEKLLNVGLVCRALSVGGAQVQMLSLTKGLVGMGHSVSLFVLYSGGALEPDFARVGAAVVQLGKRSRWDLIPVMRRFNAEVSKRRISVLYSFLPLENLLCLSVARCASIPTIWGLRSASADRGQFGVASRILYFLQSALLRFPDQIISNSEAAVQEAGLRDFTRIAVISNGIDIDRFRLGEYSLREMRPIGEEKQLLIGSVARIDRMKDLATLLRAVASLKQRGRQARCVIAGAGDESYLAELKRLSGEYGIEDRVEWMGPVVQPELIYAKLDVFVSSSIGEGFSNSIAEAMACGVPVVVTDVGDSRKIVGEFGWIVRVADGEGMADAILEARRTDTMASRIQRRESIVARFSEARMVRETERLLSNQVWGSK